MYLHPNETLNTATCHFYPVKIENLSAWNYQRTDVLRFLLEIGFDLIW